MSDEPHLCICIQCYTSSIPREAKLALAICARMYMLLHKRNYLAVLSRTIPLNGETQGLQERTEPLQPIDQPA